MGANERLFDLDQGCPLVQIGLQVVSLKRINSIAILAAAQTSVQMEFLVGTGLFFITRYVRSAFRRLRSIAVPQLRARARMI